jgi:hypothetical protein
LKWIKASVKEPRLQFPNYLSIVAIAKNEDAYFKEWIEYHLLAGVDKFYIYDNESTDSTKEILQPYIDRGIVEYKFFPGTSMQGRAVVDCASLRKYDTKWLAHIDLDEFIVPAETGTIPEFLRTLPRAARELVVTWVIYGSDGHKTKPEGLVVENFKRRNQKLCGTKTIFNPRFLYKFTNPHVLNVAGDLIDENGKKYGVVDHPRNPPPCEKIRINHYHTKSRDEYRQKHRRGDVSRGNVDDRYDEEMFLTR